jgi:hypothetical protein
MGHKTLLRRGRSLKWLQYSLLSIAALAAAAGLYGALVMEL